MPVSTGAAFRIGIRLARFILRAPSPDPFSIDLFANAFPRFEIMQSDSNRMWFLSQDKTNLIQVQRNRFVVNWRQVVGTEKYPRFDHSMLPTFKAEFARFRDFVRANVGSEIEVTICEVSYFSHLVKMLTGRK